MAGNKFRNFRNNDEKTKKESSDIERNSNIILTQDIKILTKPKVDERYYSKIIYKKGTIIKAIDKVNNEGVDFVKVEYTDINNGMKFGYIEISDDIGNKFCKKYEIKLPEEKKELKKSFKFETFGSIKLCDFKNENIQKNQEDINCHKRKDELMNRIISFITNDDNNNNNNNNNNNESHIKV